MPLPISSFIALLVAALINLLVIAGPGFRGGAPPSGKPAPAKVANASGKNAALRFEVPLTRTFPAGLETVTHTLTPEYTGYADLILTGGGYDIDLTVTGVEGESWESKGTACEEHILFPVRAGQTYAVELTLYDARGHRDPSYTITPYRVEPRAALTPGVPMVGTVAATPHYFALVADAAAAPVFDLELRGVDADDLELAVYADGELVAESLQQGSWERAVLALRAGPNYLVKVYAAQAGAAEYTLTPRLAATAPLDGTLAVDGTASGEVNAGQRYRLYRFTAPAAGVVVQQLGGGEKSGCDLDLGLAAGNGKLIYSRDSDGAEMALGNAIAGEDCYSLVALYDQAGASPYTLRNWFVPEPTRAAGTPGVAEWFGVFVGVRDYLEAGDLDYCGKDAYDFYREFQSLGMPAGNARLLIDERATKANLEAALLWLAQVAGPEDRVIVFFSGHGVRENGGTSANREADNAQDYISPWDSQNANYDYDLADDRFAALANAIPARTQVIVIDSCFSGGFVSELAPHPGRAVFLASREDQESGENTKTKGGIMVGAMLQSLRSLRRAGIPVGQLVEQVRYRVPRICPSCFAAIEPGTRVCPACHTELTGEDAVQEPVVASTLPAGFQLHLQPPPADARPK